MESTNVKRHDPPPYSEDVVEAQPQVSGSNIRVETNNVPEQYRKRLKCPNCNKTVIAKIELEQTKFAGLMLCLPCCFCCFLPIPPGHIYKHYCPDCLEDLLVQKGCIV